MQLTVNGNARDVPDGCSIPELLAQLGLADAPCAVEVNATIIPKATHATCMLHDGDRVELVTLVGGG